MKKTYSKDQGELAIDEILSRNTNELNLAQKIGLVPPSVDEKG